MKDEMAVVHVLVTLHAVKQIERELTARYGKNWQLRLERESSGEWHCHWDIRTESGEVLDSGDKSFTVDP